MYQYHRIKYGKEREEGEGICKGGEAHTTGYQCKLCVCGRKPKKEHKIMNIECETRNVAIEVVSQIGA